MKKIIALLLCLLMVVGMVACATNTDNNDQTDGSQDTTPATENSDSSDDTNGNDGDVVTITYSYWGTPDEAASVQAVADKFHEEYPNIKVEVMAIPNEEYVTKLNTMATAGELPDCGHERVRRSGLRFRRPAVRHLRHVRGRRLHAP